MKNLKKILIYLFAISFTSTAWGHGSLELIECHNKDNSVIFSGEALNKKNDFSFKLMKDNKKVWSSKKIRLQLKDTFENKKLIENITIREGNNTALIKVSEVAAREIRNGQGEFKFQSIKLDTNLICYAVY